MSHVDLDILAPTSIRAQNIVLALANPLAVPAAFKAIDFSVSLTGDALAAGLSLPLELSVTGPSSSRSGTYAYLHVFRRIVPRLCTFVPKEGGIFVVRLREIAHCRWWGALQVSVQGDPLYVPT